MRLDRTHEPARQGGADESRDACCDERAVQSRGEGCMQVRHHLVTRGRGRLPDDRARPATGEGACHRAAVLDAPVGEGQGGSRGEMLPSAAIPKAKPSWRAVLMTPPAIPARSGGTEATPVELRIGMAKPTPIRKSGIPQRAAASSNRGRPEPLRAVLRRRSAACRARRPDAENAWTCGGPARLGRHHGPPAGLRRRLSRYASAAPPATAHRHRRPIAEKEVLRS